MTRKILSNFIISIFVITSNLYSQNAPSIQWQNTIGGGSNDELYLIEQTTDGGYILAGKSESNLSGDKSESSNGSYDYWIIKTDANGNILWQNTIGGDSGDDLYSIQQTADGGYILGGSSLSTISGDKTEGWIGWYDYWIVKTDAAGNIQWQNTIGGSLSDELYYIRQTADGGYILGGKSNSSISSDKTENNNGGYDYWIIKTDAAGNIQWQNTIGGSGDDALQSIQQTTDGGYILGGWSNSNISGDKTESTNGGIDYWIIKTDAIGNIQWQNTIGGSGFDVLLSIQQTTDGGYILGGYSGSNISGDKTENNMGQSNTNDFWIVKTNSSGNIQWQNTIGGSISEELNCIRQTADGGYILGGVSESNISGDKTENSNGSWDYWIVKTNSSGNIQWQNTIGGSDFEILYSIQQTIDEGYILGGYSYSNISGDKTENSNGVSDYWIVKLFPSCAATITPASPVSFCAGSAVTLTANTGTGITYQWYKNSVAQSGATSSTYLIGSAGTYYVVETSTCGTATSNSLVVNQINNPNPTFTYTSPTTFCSPGTITFTANTFAGVTYQWQKNSIDIAGATNQTYTATTNGKYRVKQTANGCTKQGQDVQVTTATSVASVIAANGPTSFCTGGSVVLSVSNAIPGYSYQWKNNNVNISGATLSNYTATTAGSYTCYVSANCGNATSNAIAVSTGGIVALVNPSGTVNICTGATVALSANTGTGYTFQWKKNGTNISGATTQNYGATTAGNYTVAITSPCGNATSVATTVVIAPLTATASPANTTICNGSAATFTANTGYNFTYQWYRAGIAIAGATSSTHANSTAGNYTVVITQGGVCSATSNIATLTVISNPNPTVTLSGPTTFCAGQSVTITANTFAGVTYQWIKGSTNIAGATNQSYTATTAGQYNVKETASGCTKQMGVPVVVTVNCREEEENGLAVGNGQLTVVPNPFTSEFMVSGLEFKVGDRIEMMDVLGKIVYTETLTKASPSGRLVGLSSFPSGIYFLQVTTSSPKKTIKVVKQ